MAKLVAKNDKLIERLLNDERYIVQEDGIYNAETGKLLGFTKKTEKRIRNKQYRYFRYGGRDLKVHRIMYRKFVGLLDDKLVVHHIDADGLNNHPDNLELTTQEINVIEAVG